MNEGERMNFMLACRHSHEVAKHPPMGKTYTVRKDGRIITAEMLGNEARGHHSP